MVPVGRVARLGAQLDLRQARGVQLEARVHVVPAQRRARAVLRGRRGGLQRVAWGGHVGIIKVANLLLLECFKYGRFKNMERKSFGKIRM